MQTVKIQSIDNTIATRVFIGENHVEGVASASFEQSAGEIPVFTFKTRNYPNIEIDNADICFRFTPETIADAAKVIRHSFSTNRELYSAFVASIASVLKEVPSGAGLYDVAQAVADRIIGMEE